MATTQTISPITPVSQAKQETRPMRGGLPLCAVLTLFAVLVHGYHPYAEDGGIYLAGVKYLLNPALYPHSTGFVTAHLGLSGFAPLVVWLVRSTGLSLMTVMLGLYAASIFGTLYAAWQLATRLFVTIGQQRGAVLLFASALTVPVAGTSLVLMDPYVTARSLATPCILIAWSAAIDAVHAWRSRIAPQQRTIACLLASAVASLLLHPLMGGYGLIVLVFYAAVSLSTRRAKVLALAALLAAAVVLAALLNRFGLAQPAGYRLIAQTRTYWFLSGWAWYEYIGLVAPLAILFRLAATARSLRNTAFATLACAAACAGLTACILSVCFVHADAFSYIVARLQPLRIFQAVYILMLLALGAWLAAIPRHGIRLIAITCTVVPLLLFATQRSIYANSNHLEMPWTGPSNAWQQGFLWVRDHTPPQAYIALDPHYISAPGQDAQNFRAIAERSAPADFSKDGGIAAIQPALTQAWQQGVAMQSNINNPAGRASLAASGITWIIVQNSAATSLHCAYRNAVMSVCALPVQ